MADPTATMRARLAQLVREEGEFERRLVENRAAQRELRAILDQVDPAADVSPRTPARPCIRELAIQLARRSGGDFRIRDLLTITQDHGYKSDHGGLHTSLVGMREFQHVGPGRFKLVDHVNEPLS